MIRNPLSTKTLLTLLACLALTALSAAGAERAEGAERTGGGGVPRFSGPLRIRNAHPLFIASGAPELVPASREDSVSLVLTYGTTFLVQSSPAWAFAVDVETVVADLRIAKKLPWSVEASARLPLVSHNSGFLDGLLDWFHGATGLGDYGRGARPHNAFLYETRLDGGAVIDGTPGEIEVGDVRLAVKKALAGPDPAVSLMAYVDLPTGDPDQGYGSGSPGAAAGVLLDKRLGPSLMAYLNAGFVYAGTLRARQEVRLADYPYGGAGLEWVWSERLSLNGQVIAHPSPFGGTGVDEMDDLSIILSFGGRFRLGARSAIEFSFSEDPSVAGAPDVMASLGYVAWF